VKISACLWIRILRLVFFWHLLYVSCADATAIVNVANGGKLYVTNTAQLGKNGKGFVNAAGSASVFSVTDADLALGYADSTS
jgi:hypothetical protein